MKNQNSTIENVSTKKGAKAQTETLLSKLNAIGITDALKANGAKSIFKKEFSNKAERTKCRTKFLNSISIYLLHIAHDKKELADKELINIRAIANTYYLANDTFANVDDYATNNMEENKRSLIKMFIENAPKAEIKEKKVRAPKKKKEIIAPISDAINENKKEIELV